MATQEGYQYYLREKAKLRQQLEETNYLLDVAIDYDWDAYEYMVNMAKTEPDMMDWTEKKIARKLAEDDTYWITTAQAKATMEAIQNYWNEMNIPMLEREAFTIEDLYFGTEKGQEVYNKYWTMIKDYYHKLRQEGMTSYEAKAVIGKIMGSE